MHKPILSIPSPCTENWELMTAAEQGKFCGSCSKIVVDFTQMNNLEIIKYLEQNKNACGRASKNQLQEKRTYVIPLKRKNRFWPSIAAMLVVGMFSINPVFSQIDQTVKSDSIVSTQTTTSQKIQVIGTIIDEDTNEPLPYFMVIIQNTTKGTTTDENGKFELEITKEDYNKGGSLVFKSVGYETDSIAITEFKNTELIVKMNERVLGIVGYVVPLRILNVNGIPVDSPLNDYMLEYQKNEYLQGNRYSSY